MIALLPRIAHARIYIQIDQPSEKKFPVAVASLVATSGGSSGDWSKKTAEIIRKDLGLTNLFDIIPEKEFPDSAGARSVNPATIQFPPWTLIGAQALVNGGYVKGKGRVQVTMNLYDPLIGQLLVSKSYNAGEKEMSVVAHHFADAIMEALTGEPGVFSTKIAYTQMVKKKQKEIGVMDMDGLNAHAITKEKTISLSPAWSPDGGAIAFTIFNRDGAAELAIVGSGGGAVHRVTSNGSINVSPAWTPSGALTVASAMNGDTDLYIMNRNGSVVRRLTDSYGIDVNPSWAPDGSAFVFASERAGKLHIFKGGAGGGGVERLTFSGSQNDNPVWSPKGDKIAFQGTAGGWAIFVMNTDGSLIQRLESGESPTWAPNGRFIAFSRGGRVTLMREDGANPTAVGPGGSLQPAWGPAAK